jgi:predicted ATP-binding protein involved in virulence
MCYRENVPPLDFEGIHVACLCGDNGSGKSSIFDAITWALWGEASRGKSNDDLIYSNPGTNDMEVELEFLSGKDRYRVIRKHTRSTSTKSGQSLLDLQLYNQGVFKSLSEHTKKRAKRYMKSFRPSNAIKRQLMMTYYNTVKKESPWLPVKNGWDCLCSRSTARKMMFRSGKSGSMMQPAILNGPIK